MGYQGNYPPSTPLTSSQIGTGAVTSDAIADGAVVPADLSTGAPSWNTSGNATVSGNLTLSGTAKRITGDFSNATVASRVSFQDSTTNNGTYIQTLPNGTSQGSGVIVFNNSTPTNAAFMALTADATTAQVNSSITGTGTYLPMTFRTGGSERMRIDTSGNVGIGTASPGANNKLDVREGNIALTKTSGIPVSYILSNQAAGYNPPQFQLVRYGAGATATPDNSTIGEIRFDGLNAAGTYDNMATIAVTNGVNATGGAPSSMIFSTASSGAAATERMRITSNGGVSFGSSGTAYGTSGQVLQSNGDSAPTWSTIGGTISWQAAQTTGFTAVAGRGYPVNTTAGAITVTLPASPTAGDLITIADYAGTAATNNIVVSPNGNKIQGSSSSVVIATSRQTANFVYVDSTQGWISFAQQSSALSYTVSYLLVAGGGGGGFGEGNPGGDGAGGGGAGGLLTGTTVLTLGTVYTATVGAGGSGATVGTAKGNNGAASSFSTISTVGGGGGGSDANDGGAAGGSGGGTNNLYGGSSSGGAGTSGQGFAGGNATTNTTTWRGGSGGGGASAAGVDRTSGNGGAGGAGLASSITGSSVTYAGGGGGGACGTASAGAGGAGGGGTGGSAGVNGAAGTANLGGGGGGGVGHNTGGTTGGNGGSGVVIISVPTVSYSGVTTGSPTITTSGSNTIIKFTASGTYRA